MCAIYTRVSSDSGLEKEFNSLDDQREASEAYVKSQAHEGWKLIRDRYDDGGFSGGSMERPALQKLLDDVKRGRVDVIVVYKVDRLTRSLPDFAKLVELFDARGVSFVSVTQAFNTTTSMGRLTFNMPLSFAQFEREVTGERIRDKIAASKKRGLWMGGVVPLGYRVEKRALHIVEEHAVLVRQIFRRYLEVGAVVPLKVALDSENVRLPERIDGTGKHTGGGLISRGHLHNILSNPIYVGRLPHKGRVYDGQHEAIIDPETWDRVQTLLADHTHRRNRNVRSTEALLAGKLYDDRGHRMSPSEVSRGSRRWRYCVSQAVLQGRRPEAGSVPRLAAAEIEDKVLEAVRSVVGAGADSLSSQYICDGLARVTIGRAGLTIELNDRLAAAHSSETTQLSWTPRSPQRCREIVQGDGSRQTALRPMRSEARGRVAIGFRNARRWLNQLVADPATSIASTAAREKRTERSIRQTLSLAFLDPALVEAALKGQLPRGFGLKRLLDLPVAWPEQWSRLGLEAPARP
jgi:DNA invertase Pin-like site-specific DNA recombinase